MNELARIRRSRGLSQRSLAENSGVSAATINELENSRRKANPSTLRRLAAALDVEVNELLEEDNRVKVEVGSLDQEGTYRGEILRFTGRPVDSFERGDVVFELYECPRGYRVYVDDGSKPERALYPFELDPRTGRLDHPLYSASEVAEGWPEFGATVGMLPIRDID